MLHIAVCDDESIICSQIEDILLDYSKTFSEEIKVEIYFSGEELCKFLSEGMYFDMIFLDIELNLLNGVEVGKKIRGEMDNEITQIVYISAKDSYAMELFDVRPLNFLIKPLKADKINEMVRKVLKLSGRDNYFFEYKIGRSSYKVPVKEILYFESDGKKVRLVRKNDVCEFYGKLSDIEQQLQNKDFILIHKSYLINYFYVTEYQYEFVKLTNDVKLSISQQNRKHVRDMLLARRRKGINNVNK